MKVTLGDGARRIVDVINKYRSVHLGQFTRAMYPLTSPNCLWFPQCSQKDKGSADEFKKTLRADNWLSADGNMLYERARTPEYDIELNKWNNLVRITFANVMPRDGYEFVGVFEYVGRKGDYREYRRAAKVTDTKQW